MSRRNKTEQLTAALVGGFTDHHAFMVRLHLQLIDQLAAAVAELTARVDVMIEPFRPILKLLTTIPGVSDKVAVVIIAETGADMTTFPTAAQLASWAGVCPSQNESAGRTKSTSPSPPKPGQLLHQGRTRQRRDGAARTNGCYFQARYRRLAARSSALKPLLPLNIQYSSVCGT